MPLFSGEDIEEGEEMQIVLDEDGQARSVQYIEEEDAEYPGGTMEVGNPQVAHCLRLSTYLKI